MFECIILKLERMDNLTLGEAILAETQYSSKVIYRDALNISLYVQVWWYSSKAPSHQMPSVVRPGHICLP